MNKLLFSLILFLYPHYDFAGSTLEMVSKNNMRTLEWEDEKLAR